MDITMLKSGLWGYQKAGVCAYIAEINEEFSRKLMETVGNCEQKEKALTEKVAALEAENERLREERDRVTKIITDAAQFSEGLRRDAEAEDKKFRDSNEKYQTGQRHRIGQYCAAIDEIRGSIHRLLEQFDAELSGAEGDLISVDCGLQEVGASEESEAAQEPEGEHNEE